MMSRLGFALLALAASTQLCAAADPRHPDWPCVQAKVPEISLAAVWSGPPLDDAAEKWKSDPKVNALVEKTAARKLPLEEVPTTIDQRLFALGRTIQQEME
jgi:hypothetical protein